MASSSTDEENNIFDKTHFPPVIDGKINLDKFIKASIDLVNIVERLGTVYAPVKYDMQGNIDKIKKEYTCDENSCLLESMLEEAANGKLIGVGATLWLNRYVLLKQQQIYIHKSFNSLTITVLEIQPADSLCLQNPKKALLFFELAFQEIVNHIRSGDYDVSMKKIFTVAYEGSVKKYHNWVTQQIFVLICRMSPNLPQIIKIFQDDENIKLFGRRLENFNITLHLVRCKVDDFFRDNEAQLKGA